MFDSIVDETVSDTPSRSYHAPQKLNELSAGTRARVCSIESRDAAMQRFMAMGLCVGREVEVVRQGNPLIVRLLRARVGVSGRVAEHVIVEPTR